MTENEALEKHKEDCRRCRDKACMHGVDCLQKKDIEVYEELLAYRAIGTVEKFKALKKKNVAKKPIDKTIYLECTACGNLVAEDSHCQCGQYVK